MLDECGNIIGHVATVAVLTAKSPPRQAAPAADHIAGEPPANPPQLTLHDAVPASSVLMLLELANKLAP